MSQVNKPSLDSLKTRRTLKVNHKTYTYFSLPDAEKANIGNISKLPYSLKVLFENLLRFEDGKSVTLEDIKILADWTSARQEKEIAYRPARVLMQDFTGVPAVADLAAMRDAMANAKRDPNKINPLTPVDLVIDHSVQVDQYGSNHAFLDNVHIEMQRNHERYEFLRWGQKVFNNFRVVPPGTGICHQVNLEYLAKTIWQTNVDGTLYAYPDTVIGTDSHTTMINGLGVLGWGVGGIEAEAAMLGQPISMLIPEVIGFKLEGKLREGITATDLVLTVTQMLRQKGVVDKFVEFYGPGLDELPLPDRATLANMAPEYGATCGFFPIDHITVEYMKLTGRDEDTLALVEAYAKAQGLWRDSKQPDPIFTDTLKLDLNSVGASLAGPKRPQDKVDLRNLATTFHKTFDTSTNAGDKQQSNKNDHSHSLKNGDIVIAAITSCTNTSNPNVMLAAGLVAKKACEKGLKPKPWVKSSLAPGSKVVTDYLKIAGLQTYLDQLGFNLVGYGCTTCIGNSGPLREDISNAILDNNLIVSAVLSGNRNFEGRIHPQVKANWLASPPLVVALALAGTVNIDLETDPVAEDEHGKSIYLKDIWPSTSEINEAVKKINSQMFRKEYADVFNGDTEWQSIPISENLTFDWKQHSTYVRKPPFFELPSSSKEDIKNANILAIFGDSITTDHISPAGSIQAKSPAGQYLINQGVSNIDFNSYGARRGNHEVMMRGTFANIRIKNEMLPGTEGGLTQYIPDNEVMPIYDAAIKYQSDGTPLVIIAGKEYGTGSSRDWAAKGTRLLGIKAVIAESFERIHRSNLIGMGILPLQFKPGIDRKQLGLKGNETITIQGIAPTSKGGLHPRMEISVAVTRDNGTTETFPTICRIDTQNELEYYRAGGILPYVLSTL